MVNKVILLGRVGADPEIRATRGGSSVARVKLATSENRQVDGEWVESTEWHTLVMFGKTAERAEKVTKGDLLYVEGKVHYNSFENKEGVKVYNTEINVEVMRSVQKKQYPSEGRQQKEWKPTVSKKDRWETPPDEDESGW